MISHQCITSKISQMGKNIFTLQTIQYVYYTQITSILFLGMKRSTESYRILVKNLRVLVLVYAKA